MIARPPRPASLVCNAGVLLALGLITFASLARSAPVLGFLEEFPGISTSTWAGGSPFSNPGADGYLGPGDGYLLVENGVPTDLGIASGANTGGTEYVGDWTAAGITQFRVWMNDVGTDEPLEMHVALGNGNNVSPTRNFWQYDIAFMPPLHAWAEYVVPLTSSANWTQIMGSGTFANALTIVDRVLIRHDLPPFLPIPIHPDPMQGGVGIDHILLTNGLVGVPPGGRAALRPVELAAPYPNPSHGPVTFALRPGEGGPVTLQVVDVSGRSVWRADLPDAGTGPRTWLWDGRDAAGRPVPAGIYRVRAFGAAGGMSRALVRVD